LSKLPEGYFKAQEEVAAIADVREVPAAITNEQEAPAEITDVRSRKASKVLRGLQGVISRESPERIKTGGGGSPEFRVESGTSICMQTAIETVAFVADCGGGSTCGAFRCAHVGFHQVKVGTWRL
jgi:hypothetical protein